MNKRPRVHKYFLFLIVCILVFSLLLPGCGDKGGEGELVTPGEEEEASLPDEDEVYMPTPADIQLISQTECGDNQTCYHVLIDYEGLAPREVEIRVEHNSNSEGTVVLMGGGWGTRWFGDAGDSPREILDTVQNEGYETYEVKWLGDQGWGNDNPGEGPKKLSLALTDIIRWIVSDIAINADVTGAFGVSASTNLLAYGLTMHGLEDTLDLVVLASGTAWSDLTILCDIGLPGAKWIVDYLMGWMDAGDYCQGEDNPEWTVQALQEQSIITSVPGELRNYHYPSTKVSFIVGELDEPVMVNGRLFYDAITSDKSWVVLPGVGHGVLSNPDGAVLIQETLLEGLEGSD